MKKTLTMLLLMLVLGTGTEATAQSHRHTPRQQEELVDTAKKDAVEVFSDTTSIDSAAAMSDDWMQDEDDSQQVKIGLERILNSVDGDDLAGMLFVLGILFIIFVLAPVLIIIALFYFINKNRKQKMKLAQMAMQQGQPIPEQLLEENAGTLDDEYQKGMRQCFVGVGLMIFLGYAAGNVGFGLGALVFCIGLGKVFAAKTAQKKNDNNDLIKNNYD